MQVSALKRMLGRLHHKFVYTKRAEALARAIAPLLTPGEVLDVGAGNGMIGSMLMAQRQDINVTGIDVHLRSQASITVRKYDGRTIPFSDNSFSSIIAVDVFHHIDDYIPVLPECARVCAGTMVVKDHFYSNKLDYILLCFIDWVGNMPHGVRLPYSYFTRNEWEKSLQHIGISELFRQDFVKKLYPFPFQFLIGRRIQFVSQLSTRPPYK